MTDHEILSRYIPMVDFIADICGTNFEVVLHDISQPSSSVIAIRNGHHSGRSIGSPMTDLAVKIMKDKSYLEKDFLTNYTGIGSEKDFLSSTYYIKNGDRLIGMLCVNNDISPIINLKHFVSSLENSYDYKNSQSSEVKETLEQSVVSVAKSIITKTIAKYNVPAERMSIEEKIRIVQELDDQGVFLLKGAIADVAKELAISEGTVYRYLNKKVHV